MIGFLKMNKNTFASSNCLTTFIIEKNSFYCTQNVKSRFEVNRNGE